MASLIQGLKNLKANIGTAASELQHVANQLQGSGGEEKRFLEAIYDNKPMLVSQLLSANPNVIYARTKDWHNAWHIAAGAGNLTLLEVLHTHGRGATRKPLPGEPPHHAAKTRDTRETPLMLACAGNHLTAMQYLLGVGAKITENDKYGNTIVHYTALRGQVKMLQLLLALDEGQLSEQPKSAEGKDKVVRLVDMRNEAGLQPLHFAVWGGHPECVRALFEHRPDLVAKSVTDSLSQVTCNGGSTPLHVAALRNDPFIVELLLQEYVRVMLEGRGVRSDPRTVFDNYNFTPFSVAKDLKREAVLPLLDPVHVLKGLEPGAIAAALAAGGVHGGVLGRQGSMRRSQTGMSAAAAAAAVADAFDGFSALAAGSPGEKALSRNSLAGGSKSAIPILAPPPPSGSKAGSKAAAAVLPTLLAPPPSPGSKRLGGGAPTASSFTSPSTPSGGSSAQLSALVTTGGLASGPLAAQPAAKRQRRSAGDTATSSSRSSSGSSG